MSVYALDFGTTDSGIPTHLYRLKNSSGMEVDVTDVGASLVAVRIPTKDGALVDVTLGFDEATRYEQLVLEGQDYAFGLLAIAQRGIVYQYLRHASTRLNWKQRSPIVLQQTKAVDVVVLHRSGSTRAWAPSNH